jgi:hypothetical protein
MRARIIAKSPAARPYAAAPVADYCSAAYNSSMARKFRHRKRRLTQFGHSARPTNALADSDVFCGEFRPFTMPLTSKSRGGTVPFITAGALIMLGTALFFVFAG